MADEMEIINPKTSGIKLVVGADNLVSTRHDCTFAGDHTNGLNPDDKCTECGKTLGDFIAESFDPTKPQVPIIIVPGGSKDE